MFVNRISRNLAIRNESPATKTPFALMGAPCAPAAANAIYRDAYLRAFATVQQRVIRRRELRAACLVSWN
jgi:hypothetical protein